MNRTLSGQMIATAAVVVLAVTASGCRVGPSVHSDRLARGPGGSPVEAHFHRQGTVTPAPIRGELLALTDTSLIVLTHPWSGQPGNQVVVVPLPRLERLQVDKASRRVSLSRGRPHLEPLLAQRIRMRARYPHGLDERRLGGLLEAYRQESLIVYPPTPAVADASP